MMEEPLKGFWYPVQFFAPHEIAVITNGAEYRLIGFRTGFEYNFKPLEILRARAISIAQSAQGVYSVLVYEPPMTVKMYRVRANYKERLYTLEQPYLAMTLLADVPKEVKPIESYGNSPAFLVKYRNINYSEILVYNYEKRRFERTTVFGDIEKAVVQPSFMLMQSGENILIYDMDTRKVKIVDVPVLPQYFYDYEYSALADRHLIQIKLHREVTEAYTEYYYRSKVYDISKLNTCKDYENCRVLDVAGRFILVYNEKRKIVAVEGAETLKTWSAVTIDAVCTEPVIVTGKLDYRVKGRYLVMCYSKGETRIYTSWF